MPIDFLRKHRTRLAFVVVVASGIAAGWCIFATRSDAAPRGVLTYETDGFRYEYQLVTGRESLFATCDGPQRFVDVASANAPAVAACRRALEKELGVPNLSVLRREDEDRDEIARLRAIGYL